ncbi:MAG: pyridoxamine 5'-phosphate oxidase family protein [Pseudomonadota bacterium]
MTDPNDLRLFLDEAWQRLCCGVADAQSPARYPSLATVSPTGAPQVRTVALRAANRLADTVEVQTDTQSSKMAALHANPLVELHVWEPETRVQTRLSARAEILTGETTRARWEAVPAPSRLSYGTRPAPGTPIGHVYDYEKPPDPSRFAVIVCHLTAIDLVHLGDRHRRARYLSEDGWAGTWLAP